MATQQQAPGTGVFITFEGGDGAGKTTHINFLARGLRSQGREVVCLREPGGTRVGEALRAVVLDPENGEICDETELLIYEAARAQIVTEIIAPALERGAVVLCDRFYDSTTAYQAYGRGLSEGFVRRANDFACKGIHPDRTLLMVCDAPAQVGLERATHHGTADRMEQAGLDFHMRVNAGFSAIAAQNAQRIRTVVNAELKCDTAKRVFAAIADLVGWDPANLPFSDEFFAQADIKKHDAKVVVDQEA